MMQQEYTEEGAVIRRKSRKPRIILGVSAVVLVTVLGAGYAAGANYYQTHFLPGTIINGMDCGRLDAAETAQQLGNQLTDFSLEVIGRDEKENKQSLAIIQESDIGLTYENMEQSIASCFAQQNPWLWGLAYLPQAGTRVLEWKGSLVYDEQMLSDFLGKLEAFQVSHMQKPRDAYITGYSEETKGFALIPEVVGDQLDVEAAEEAVRFAIENNAGSVDLEEENCYVLPNVTAQNERLRDTLDTLNTWIDTEITYDWNGNKVVVDETLLKDWISLEGDVPTLDEEAVAAFVKENAKLYDTYGRTRKFVTTLGVELSLGSGAFGWKTDCDGETKALIQAIKKGAKEEREPLYLKRGAQKGKNDIGSSYVEADLTHQHLYLYQNGNIVLETDFVSGDMASGCATPPGVFGITYKTMNAVLRGADYETPVVYWMPFHGNYGMHDATWRTEFGGELYLEEGSHGCINLPLDMAGSIYSYMSEGFPVICYYY